MSHRLPLADIQFIADFAAFCRTKGDGAYDCTEAQACALAQFGYPGVQERTLKGVPHAAFSAAVCETDPEAGLDSFSALADRLEALIADAPAVVSA